MLLPWNRREVYMGFSMKECSRIMDLLAQKQIPYTYRVKNPLKTGNSMIGRVGERMDYQKMYYVYVHKKDRAALSPRELNRI